MSSTNASNTTNTVFAQDTVKEIFSKVKDHSSIVKLSGQVPVSFAGNDYFTFSLDSEVSIVGEGAAKPAGNATIAPVTMKPIKVVYQHRLSDEFLKTSDEKALGMLAAFTDGFSKKIAKGLDIMAMHGLNPYDMTASTTIGTNHLDSAQNVVYSSTDGAEVALTSAVSALGDYDATGYALSKTMGEYLGALKENGVSQYPEFKLGGNPGNLAGHACDVNSTVSAAVSGATATDLAIVGDFQNAFKWGFAENIPMEVIQYGDPDGLGDLKKQNQVVLRAEAYIGWAILDADAFARVTTA